MSPSSTLLLLHPYKTHLGHRSSGKNAPAIVFTVLCPQHICHTPSVAVIGRQCHIQPSGSRSAPMFDVSSTFLCDVTPPSVVLVPTFFVDVFVASFSKVPMMSVAWQTQSSPPLSRYSLCLEDSPHARAMVSSGCPGPAGSCTLRSFRKTAPALLRRHKARRASIAVYFIDLRGAGTGCRILRALKS